MRDQPDDNRSVWVAESAPAQPNAALSARIAADVAIVGGGFTGVSTAWHLAQRRPGLGIVLLEAGVLGQGASGRNGGQVLHWINGVEPRGPEETRRIHAATGVGIDLAETLAARYAPPGTFRRSGCLEIYTDPRRAEAAERHVAELGAAGVAAEFVPAGSLAAHGAYGAILDPLAGRLNGYALLQALRPALVGLGVRVYEGSAVRRVRGGDALALETDGGEVRARALVLATNGYTPALGFFRGALLPLHSHVLATAPLGEELWRRIGWGAADGFTDDYDRIAYACRTPGGRLLFGGGGNAAYTYRYGGPPVARAHDVTRAADFMRAAVTRYFPALADAEIAQRWSGTLGLTLDRVCTMGVGLVGPNVYHALGYSGHGVALALLAGRVLADLYDGDHEPWRDLPFYQRRPPLIPPEPLRWLGYQVMTRATGKSPRRKA